MLNITVNRQGTYYDNNLREADLDFKDAYNINAVFSPTCDEDGEPIGCSDDMVNMFVSAMRLEGYADRSIAQSLYDVAMLMVYEGEFMLHADDGDPGYLKFDKNPDYD